MTPSRQQYAINSKRVYGRLISEKMKGFGGKDLSGAPSVRPNRSGGFREPLDGVLLLSRMSGEGEAVRNSDAVFQLHLVFGRN